MKTIRKIMVFENDKFFLVMLKGYCYANNIQLTEASFNRDGINQIEKVNPALIFIPVDWVSVATNSNVETALLRRACESRRVKVCGLNKKASDMASETVPEWFDAIIENPLDIVEIDSFLKKIFLYDDHIPERRAIRERRAVTDRRRGKFNGEGYNGSKIREFEDFEYSLHGAMNAELIDFHVDVRNKQLFLKGRKIDLTPKEFDLIEYLATDADRIFTPDEIIKHLWPRNHRATKSDLYQYIHLLRKKVESDRDRPKLILTAKGFGYKLNVSNLKKHGSDAFPISSVST